MDGKINVVIYGNSYITNFLYSGLKNFLNLNILGCFSNSNEIKTVLAYHHFVVLVFFSDDVKHVNSSIFSFIKGTNLKTVIVTENVTDGFSLLKDGFGEMVILKEMEKKSGYYGFFRHLDNTIQASFKKYFKDTSRELKFENNDPVKKIIAIGCSTGGTETLIQIVKELPEDIPPLLIVQHMPPVFTKIYAQRLNNICNFTVWEAQDGDVLKNGLALVAQGERQMSLEYRGKNLVVNCNNEEKNNGHCPSVDVLFNSIANVWGKSSIGVILTGMGCDGARGLLNMKNKGAYTIGQDQFSSVVYGMPKVAFDMGAVCKQVPLKDIQKSILINI